jgi:hypothetical protein
MQMKDEVPLLQIYRLSAPVNHSVPPVVPDDKRAPGRVEGREGAGNSRGSYLLIVSRL